MNQKLEIEIREVVKDTLPSKNGLIHKDHIDGLKEKMIRDTMSRYYYLVDNKVSYPQNNEVDVEFEIDLILMTRSRFMELKETEFNYLKLCN
jgi:hypothetical protein